MRALKNLDPLPAAFGLALDEALLAGVRSGGEDVIRFWVNEPAVIVGRSQRVSDEVDLEETERRGIIVLRRISGGGTVLHYPGNLNVSLALRTRREVVTVSDAFRFLGTAIGDALSHWARVECVENTIRWDGRKMGGAAQARWGRALLYHTTLLLAPAGLAMEDVLLAHRPGYAPQRVASRPSRTVSLAEATGRPVGGADVATAVADVVAERLSSDLRWDQLRESENRRAAGLVEAKYGRETWTRSRNTT